MPDCTVTGASNTQTDSNSTIYRPTRQTSTRSNESGNSPSGNACTIDTSHCSERSSIRSKTNSTNGCEATSRCVDYAQLLQTLCLAGPDLKPVPRKPLDQTHPGARQFPAWCARPLARRLHIGWVPSGSREGRPAIGCRTPLKRNAAEGTAQPTSLEGR